MGSRARERSLGVATVAPPSVVVSPQALEDTHGEDTLDNGFPPRPPVALYVHVPFCISVCPYCDFVVYGGAASRGPKRRIDDFVAALAVEIRLRAEAVVHVHGHERDPLESLYFGGGTPSLLSAMQIDGLIRAVREGFGLAQDVEITLEANPGASDLGDLEGFRSAGVNRLSIGVQSLDASELRMLGRRHSRDDVANALRAARRAGFENIGVDLLYDIPGQTVDTWGRTLDGVLALDVEHVSAYALTLHEPDPTVPPEPDVPGAPLQPVSDHLPVSAGAQRWRRRARSAQDEDRAADLYAIAEQRLDAAGLRWYEISNWARPGRESRHNLAYWTGRSYDAVGPGAHAYDGGSVRRWNGARLDSYVDALLPPGGPARLPPGGFEILTPDVVLAERDILALRLERGIDRAVVTRPAARSAIEWATTLGLLEQVGAATRLTLRGRLLGNELFERLL